MRASPLRTVAAERGETLLELLIAVVILGVVVVAVVGGFATATITSDIHRKQSTAGAYAKDYAEAIQTAVSTASVPYTNCANTSTYASPAGFTARATRKPYGNFRNSKALQVGATGFEPATF